MSDRSFEPLLYNNNNNKDNEYNESDVMNPKIMKIKPYHTNIALAMTLNYIIGTGCFGLPYAFSQAGIILTSLLLIIGILGALITTNYTIESLARAEGVSIKENKYPNHRFTYRKFDFTTIGYLFGGHFCKNSVQIIICLYAMGTLWSYASVFSSSMSSIFYSYFISDTIGCNVYSMDPLPSLNCMNLYYINMFIYACIVISMVLINLGEQASIQRFLSFYRIFAIIIMIITMIIKMYNENYDDLIYRYNSIGNFNWKNFSYGFGPSLLAINCQYNIPDAMQPLKEKHNIRFVAFLALLLSGILYLLLGILGALSFGHINPLISLNWSTYSGCGSNGWIKCHSDDIFQYYIGYVIKLLILLLPVFNVTSSFPMVGITVGDNLFMCLPKKFKIYFRNKNGKNICRLIAIIPPLILAVCFKRLEFILTISGLFGFLLGLTIPTWFHIISIDYCNKKYGSINYSITSFSINIISSRKFSIVFLICTLFITAIAVITLFL